MVMIVCLTFIYSNSRETCASNSDQYLVLVQQKNGSWIEYKNIIEVSSRGNLMVKAKTLSKALGFSYKNYSKSFVIRRSSTKYNSYGKNKIEYTYTNGTVKSSKLASNEAYTSNTSKYNLCQVSTLSTLVNYKYFDKPDIKSYSEYSGVICYSKYKEIPISVPESEPTPTKAPSPTQIPEPKTIIVEGVEFPVRNSFLAVNKTLSDWGGAMNNWYSLEQEIDGSIIDATDLIIGSNTIEFTHLVAGSNGVKLSKASKGYKISISVKLSGSVLADQNAEILKAMIATISSKPILVYTAIFDSFNSDDTHGINEDKYAKIGDCNIKVEIKNGVVTYYILEADK